MSTGSMESSIDKEYALQPVPLTARLSLIATVTLWAGLTLDPSAPYLASCEVAHSRLLYS
jgi:hypothetical protein